MSRRLDEIETLLNERAIVAKHTHKPKPLITVGVETMRDLLAVARAADNIGLTKIEVMLDGKFQLIDQYTGLDDLSHALAALERDEGAE